MSYTFGKRSKDCLQGVHPDLQKVSNEVIKRTEHDYGIYSGDRTVAEQIQNIEKGVSKTINSRHLHKCAIDFIVYREEFKGKEFDDVEGFRYIAELYIEVGKEMGIAIEWGGHWTTFSDLPHLQLSHTQYPDLPEVLDEIRVYSS